MKSIVIAGNGPSLAQIDYTRLPQDFDVFRCNQFYFEDRYFLGKKIKGVFFNPFVLKQQFWTLHRLKDKGEYEVEDVYCNITMGKWDREWGNGKSKNLEEELKYDYPSVKSTYPYLSAMKDFDALLKFFVLYYNLRFTSGVMMLITALAQGYKEIYLTGIDFYEDGGLSYAFEVKNKPRLSQCIPLFDQEGFKDQVHQKHVDIEGIKLASMLEGVKIYALSPSSTLAQIIPLAPSQNQTSFEVYSKPKDYICDFVELPEIDKKDASIPPPLRLMAQKASQSGIKSNNFFVKLFLDSLELFRGIVYLILNKR
ncbi:alpha-2,3-sialyltransferase [Helicobacter kayseriensis]|uniref:alpha-2,3-sialyltransferase n=1 Tax=Helicobacter kayseriensis TaxID=2905877 RepID=UPI001E3D8A90|nr:alpha-2,3-sialyltransferase [Helicobacter kayseriensis]MCE3047134.1 alpha-2,3 sialyltransferase [Helicobacter kayseriensis]MCE3048505.1 alpha-2,3 sialyltransferase [Helicobacter kayseriensis]